MHTGRYGAMTHTHDISTRHQCPQLAMQVGEGRAQLSHYAAVAVLKEKAKWS